MRVKLDENIGRRGQELLRKASFMVSTVSEQDMEGVPDQNLIEICHREERCLITLDLDFANPIHFPPMNYSGIVVLRLPARPGLEDLLQALESFIVAARDKDLRGKLWVVSRRQVREYEGRK